jgi:hypothetical protein
MLILQKLILKVKFIYCATLPFIEISMFGFMMCLPIFLYSMHCLNKHVGLHQPLFNLFQCDIKCVRCKCGT